MHSKTNPTTALRAGTGAPEFTLRSTPDQFVSLTEFRGRPVVLAFYPADWSPVCGGYDGPLNEGALFTNLVAKGKTVPIN